MKVNTILATVSLAAVATACKCIGWGGYEDGVITSQCCGQVWGLMSDGAMDCGAYSVANRLHDFKRCCGKMNTYSDCAFPGYTPP